MNSEFKLYENKNSLAKPKTRLLNIGEAEVKGNKIGWWERETLIKDPSTDITITITDEFHKRPSMVAHKYYGKSILFWLVLQYNNIVDVEEEFLKGMEIIIPSKARALSEFSGKNPKKGVFDD